MAKKSKKFLLNRQRYVVVALGLLFISCGIMYYVKVRILAKYDSAYQQSIMVSTRELTIRAAEGTKVPAPLDAQTGDVYFPEAKLYVSNVPSQQQLT